MGCSVCSVRQCGAKHKIYSAASNWQLDKPVLTPIVQPRAGVHGPGKYGPKIHGSEVYGPEMHGPGVYDPGHRVHDHVIWPWSASTLYYRTNLSTRFCATALVTMQMEPMQMEQVAAAVCWLFHNPELEAMCGRGNPGISSLPCQGK